MKQTVRAGLIAVVALAALVLTTCDSSNILAVLTNEVKKSTGRLLVVNAVTPSHTSTNVNPGARMTVTFDRSLDMSTVSASTIQIAPVPSPADAPNFHLNFSFNDATKTLYIDSDPWLVDMTDYTLTVTTGVKGKEGSEPEKNYSWSFQTGIAPKGTLKIEADKPFTNKGPGQVLAFDLSCYDTYYSYRVAASEAAVNGATWVPMPGALAAFPGDTSAGYKFPVGTLDGIQTVYYQFKDKKDVVSAFRSDTITLDTVKPTITTYSNPAYHNMYGPALPRIQGTDDRSGVDPTAYVWTPNASTGFSSTTVQAPSVTVTGSENVTYPVTVIVKDFAGNISDPATVNVIKDTIAPNPPVFAAGTTSSPTVLAEPTWTWTAGGGGGAGYDIILLDRNGERIFKDGINPATPIFPVDAKYLDNLRGDRIYPLADGACTLSVRDSDAAGNHSLYQNNVITITPVIPFNRSTGVPGTSVTFAWRAFGKGAPYVLLVNSTLGKFAFERILTNSFTCPVNLSGNFVIEWYVIDASGSKSALYSFETGK